MDHEQRQIRGIGDPCGGDVHEVFQTPVLFGIPEVTLDLASQAIVVHQLVLGETQVTAQQDDMRSRLCLSVRFDDEDDMQRVHELLVEQLYLVQSSLDVLLHSGLFEVLHREVVVIHLVAIRAMWTTTSIQASVGQVQRRVGAQFGDEVPIALSGHVQGVVVAEWPSSTREVKEI